MVKESFSGSVVFRDSTPYQQAVPTPPHPPTPHPTYPYQHQIYLDEQLNKCTETESPSKYFTQNCTNTQKERELQVDTFLSD